MCFGGRAGHGHLSLFASVKSWLTTIRRLRSPEPLGLCPDRTMTEPILTCRTGGPAFFDDEPRSLRTRRLPRTLSSESAISVEGRHAPAGRAGRRRGYARRRTSKSRAARPEPAWCPGDLYVPFGASSWVFLFPSRDSQAGRHSGVLAASWAPGSCDASLGWASSELKARSRLCSVDLRVLRGAV